MPVPIGIAIVISAVARPRSLSENHLLQIIWWQFSTNGAEHARIIVPISTGQNQPVSGDKSLNIAPQYCRVAEARSTRSVEKLAYAQTATKVIGMAQAEKDTAHRFTGMEDLR